MYAVDIRLVIDESETRYPPAEVIRSISIGLEELLGGAVVLRNDGFARLTPSRQEGERFNWLDKDPTGPRVEQLLNGES